MPQSNIMRVVPVSARKSTPPPGFRLFGVHATKSKVVDHVPMLFSGDYKYFHINSAGRDTLAPLDRMVTDDHGQRRRWRVYLGAITGSNLPEQLVLAVAQSGNLEDVIWSRVNEVIDATIHELGMGGESAVTKPSSAKFEAISLAITDRLLADLGLHMSATVRPAIDIKPVEDFKTEEFQVKLSDMRADDTLRLSLEVTVQSPLSQQEREAMFGMLPDRADITLAMQAATQKYLASKISLQQFCFREDFVQSELIRECNAVLPTGMTILSLSLHWLNPFRRNFPTEITKAVACKVQPNLTPMTIYHTLSVSQEDIAKWRKARVPDENLTLWIDSRLEAITGSILSQKTFVEVMTDFAKVKEEIKGPFAAEMELIGFKATQHIAHTQNRELEKILETRTFDVETQDEEFATKSGTVRFGLRIAAQIKLADLEKVKGFIEPSVDFKVPFVEALRTGAAQAIRKLDPEDLYAVFSEESEDNKGSTAPNGGDAIDVESDVDPSALGADELIKSHIIKELSVYNANQGNGSAYQGGKDIDLTFVPSAMDRIYSALGPRRPKELELHVEAQDESGGETVTIDMRYSLHIARKGWTRFHQQCHNLLSDPELTAKYSDVRMREAAVGKSIVASIHDLIKQNAEAKLGLLPLDFFVIPSDGGNQMAEAVALYGFSPSLKSALKNGQAPPPLRDSAVKRVEEDFGIRVSSRGFRIRLTEAQEALRELHKSTREHSRTKLAKVRENEVADLNNLEPDDQMLNLRAAATKSAQDEANKAVTQNTPLEKQRERMRNIAIELNNMLNLDDASDESDSGGTDKHSKL